MPKLVNLRTFHDDRGDLTVIERDLGFPIKRVYYIYDVKAPRGGHGHIYCLTALIAVHGQITVTGQNPDADFEFQLTHPSQCLLLDPKDWHKMQFSPGAVLLVLASHEYALDDYFFDKFRP